MKRASLAAALVSLLLGCQQASRDAAAPFVVPHAAAPVERVFASEAGGWAARLAALGKGVTAVPAEQDAAFPSWPTDAWVFGYRGGRLEVLEMPVERPPAARSWRRIRVGAKREFPEGRFDAGGNILVSPPVPGRFPLGRIITSAQVQPALKEFFRAQRVQAGHDGQLVELDTAWLKVGHVDEIVAFVPAAAGGFRLVLPDPEAGLKLLAAVPPERVLFAAQSGAQMAGAVTAAGARFLEDRSRDFGKGRWTHVRITSGKAAGLVARVARAEGSRLIIERCWDLRGGAAAAVRAARDGVAEAMPVWFDVPDATSRYIAVEDSRMWLDGRGEEFPALITAGELVRDPSLASAAAVSGRRIYGPGGIRETVSRALGLVEDEAIRLPVLFCADEAGGAVAALAPNPVNLVCLGGAVLLLKPLGPRENPADESTDVLLRAWRQAIERLGVRPVFLDGWDGLHRRDGGARCGTNVLRRL